MLTSKSVETLIDLVEIKLSCLEVWDREDAKERRALEIALKELVAMRTGAKRAVPKLMELLAERTPVYASVATMRIDTTGRTPAEVTQALAAQLEGATHG